MRDPFLRNALLLWSGQFVAETGNSLFLLSAAWLAKETTGEDWKTGLLVFVATVPILLFAPPAGVWVDRTDKRRVMVASDLLRAAVLVPVPWLVAWTGPSYALLLVVAFLVGAFGSPFQPARDALLPDLARGRPLTRWNASLQTSNQVAQILGLVVGGWLLTLASDAAAVDRVFDVLRYNGVTYLVSAATLALLVVPRRPDPPAGPRPRTLAALREGLSYAWKDPVVRPLLVLTALDNLAIMGPAIVGATLLVKDTMGLGAAHLAWFEGAMAAGMLGGSFLLASAGPRWRPGRLVLVGMVMDGLTYLPFAFVEDFAVGIPWIVLHGAFIPFIVVGRTSLLQTWLPADRRGKVFALVGVTVTGMTALSAVASGWVGEVAGPHALFALAGGLGALCGLAGFLGWRRVLDRVGAPHAASPSPTVP